MAVPCATFKKENGRRQDRNGKKILYAGQRMTVGMAASVVAYGAIGYYLIQMGKAGPTILNAQTYPLVKYGALAASVLGIFAAGQLSHRIFSAFSAQVPDTERSPQKLFVKTVLMSAGLNFRCC
jgi:hypothetical protein